MVAYYQHVASHSPSTTSTPTNILPPRKFPGLTTTMRLTSLSHSHMHKPELLIIGTEASLYQQHGDIQPTKHHHLQHFKQGFQPYMGR